jgi:hypothetical protein
MIPHTESSHHEHAADPRAWLQNFPAARRSAISNWFYYAVRGGHTTPAAVIHQVQQEIQRRLQWARDTETEAHLHIVQEALQTDRAGALAYAESIIAYEQLPYEVRQRIKAERAAPYLEQAMRRKPVTERQTAFLRALGYVGPQPEDRAAASALIDRLTREGGQP